MWHETRVHMAAEQSSMITGEAQLVAAAERFCEPLGEMFEAHAEATAQCVGCWRSKRYLDCDGDPREAEP